MKKYMAVIIAVVVVMAAALYFYNVSEKRETAQVAGRSSPSMGGAGSAASGPGGFAGEVVETMNSGGYTYVHLKTRDGDVWAAGPETPVKVGDAVTVPAGMKMEPFKSETLNRDFDAVYFVSEIRVGAAGTTPTPTTMPQGHPPVGSSSASALPEGVDLSGIEVPAGGKSIAALYEDRKALAGRDVIVRGRVVKFTPAVMGKNWVHLRDGTGAEGSNDLTVTTDATVAIGDLVTARGTVVLDKDFGFGYSYAILVENAKVTKE
jgi:hypothetical protein